MRFETFFANAPAQYTDQADAALALFEALRDLAPDWENVGDPTYDGLMATWEEVNGLPGERALNEWMRVAGAFIAVHVQENASA